MAFALSQIFIKRAEPQEAGRLTEIALAAKRHWNYPASWIEHWRASLTVTPEFVAVHETFCAMADAMAIGFYALEPKKDRMDLAHMWVFPGWMGRGVGGLLFGHALERTAALGFSELEIESDPNAEGFYLKLGARRIGTNVRAMGEDQRELPVLIYEIRSAV